MSRWQHMTLFLSSWCFSPNCKCPVAPKGFSYLDSAVIGGCRCEPLDLIALAGASVDDMHGPLHLAPVQPVLGDFCSVARRALRGEGEILLSSCTYTQTAPRGSSVTLRHWVRVTEKVGKDLQDHQIQPLEALGLKPEVCSKGFEVKR